MVNSQNIAVLSEKVADLEAAIKNAGIELPEVTSSDNGKALQVVNGAWATGDNLSPITDTTSNMFSILKQGSIVVLQLNTASITLESDDITLTDLIPEALRPSYVVTQYTKTYNGSNYVDCIINIGSDGKIKVMDMFGNKITGLQTTYIRTNRFVYFI